MQIFRLCRQKPPREMLKTGLTMDIVNGAENFSDFA